MQLPLFPKPKAELWMHKRSFKARMKKRSFVTFIFDLSKLACGGSSPILSPSLSEMGWLRKSNYQRSSSGIPHNFQHFYFNISCLYNIEGREERSFATKAVTTGARKRLFPLQRPSFSTSFAETIHLFGIKQRGNVHFSTRENTAPRIWRIIFLDRWTIKLQRMLSHQFIGGEGDLPVGKIHLCLFKSVNYRTWGGDSAPKWKYFKNLWSENIVYTSYFKTICQFRRSNEI